MIVVFGSNVLDLFFHQADLPPHDQVKFLDSHEEAPGGKGANQAVAAARAGSTVKFYGALGDGGHGRQMYKNLGINKVDVSGVEMLEGVPSGLATIFINDADGKHKIVVSQGANLLARQATVPDSVLGKDTTVLVQGELPMKETEALILRAKAKGARTVMNFAPADKPLSRELLQNLDVIILNEHEADAVGRMFNLQTSDKTAFSQELFNTFNLTTVVTMGGIGSIVTAPEGTYMVSPLKIKPIDTVGAGDAYTGYFCAALDQGKSLEDAFKTASVAGSLACTKVGAQTALPMRDEVDQYLAQINITRISAPEQKFA